VVLRGGLPATMTCDLGDIAVGSTLSVDDLMAVVRSLYVAGSGQQAATTATVTLRLDGAAVGTPRTVDLPPVELLEGPPGQSVKFSQ
jgi:hypothetical protein